MKAGRELDALVAQHVMGDKVVDGSVIRGTIRSGIPRYSTDIVWAWKVVEELCQLKPKPIVTVQALIHGIACSIDFGHRVVRYSDTTAPLAICLAALKALKVDIERSDKS